MEILFKIYYWLSIEHIIVFAIALMLVISGTTRKISLYVLKHPISLHFAETFGKIVWSLGISVSGAAVYALPSWDVLKKDTFILGVMLIASGLAIEELSVYIKEKRGTEWKR